MQEKEPAPAEARRIRLDHCKRCGDRDRGIESVTAARERLPPRRRRERMRRSYRRALVG